MYRKKSKRDSSPLKDHALPFQVNGYTQINEHKYIEVLLERRMNIPKRPSEFKVDFSIYS